MCRGTQQAVCCPVVYCTSSKAFGILCVDCGIRFLVYVGNPEEKSWGFLQDPDLSWQHDLVYEVLSTEVTMHLSRLAGGHGAPWRSRDRCEASLQTTWGIVQRTWVGCSSLPLHHPLLLCYLLLCYWLLCYHPKEEAWCCMGINRRDTNEWSASTGSWRETEEELLEVASKWLDMPTQL